MYFEQQKIFLAPKVIEEKARLLAEDGNYKEALNLLEEHITVFEVDEAAGTVGVSIQKPRFRPPESYHYSRINPGRKKRMPPRRRIRVKREE